MGKSRRRTIATIGLMTLFAAIILLFYYYWSNRVTPIQDTSVLNLSETEKILAIDLETHYPETPREVVKVFARIMKALYNDSKDAEIEPLAMKIRGLYDAEFLDNNPESTYLNNLLSDIAEWKDSNRRITNYLLVNKDLEQEKEIDGVKYSVNYVSYTIQEKGKYTEIWKILSRQDEDGKWKILGWEFVPAKGN